jgi:hypothetical protein
VHGVELTTVSLVAISCTVKSFGCWEKGNIFGGQFFFKYSSQNQLPMGKYKDLRVWQDSLDLAQKIYEITRLPGFSTDFGLINQIRRAIVSVSSNIAEGDERGSNRECIHFLTLPKGR